MDIPAYLSYALRLLMTPNGMLSAAGLIGLVWLARMARKRLEIPGLGIEVLREDSWFVHRDDTHRLAAIISLRLTNKSGQEVRLKSVRFSGYSPKEVAPSILLEGKSSSHPLPFPAHDRYYRGLDYRIAPFGTQTIWLYFDSGSVDLRSRISAPLVIRDERSKRTSVRVEIIRHPYQTQLYQQH